MLKCSRFHRYFVVFVLNDTNTLRLFVLFIQTFCPIYSDFLSYFSIVSQTFCPISTLSDFE